jgi:TolB-like protein
MGNKFFIFSFDDVVVREREFALTKGGTAQSVEPKAFRVLLILLRNPQKLVAKEELMKAVWGDAAVTDNSLTRSIALLRKMLGDDVRQPRYIETVATVGYRFLAPVEVEEEASAEADAAEPKPPHVSQHPASADQEFWVAVLPFQTGSGDANLRPLAEGLTEEVVTGLCRFSYLRVISRTATSRFTEERTDSRAAAKELGARYVIDGSLRCAGNKLRIAVHLVDATSGADLWAEMYERQLQPESGFDIVDDVAPRIVCTVAHARGILPHSMTETLRNRDPGSLTPYEALLRSFAYFPRVDAGEHLAARTALERAVEQAPDRGDCWAMLSILCCEEYAHGFNLRPEALGRALAAARRAVEAAPSNHLAHRALAVTLFHRHDMNAFHDAAERTVSLNPMDGFTMAQMGFLVAYGGKWERGCALAEKARSLSPHHPAWYWFPDFFNAYRKRDYRGALAIAARINMRSFWRTHLALAAVYGQLGKREAGEQEVQELLAIKPDFAAVARRELRKWWDAELTEHLIDGLRKSGLEIPDESLVGRSVPSPLPQQQSLVPPGTAMLARSVQAARKRIARLFRGVPHQ